MNQNDPTFSFQQLIDDCSHPDSADYEHAWRQFIERYKLFIYNHVARSCRKWNVPRLNIQYSETVNDIFSEVIMVLCNNACKALKDFRARDNEKMFLSWLATICSRSTGRFIQSHFTRVLSETEIDTFIEYLIDLDFDTRWELYEAIVARLRSASGAKKRNLERDVHVFLLYVWADFSAPMQKNHPCLKSMEPHAVDVVVNRIRQQLNVPGQKE
ncbi:MAG: hypothetical protein ACOY90_07955 [Candidatus Zhuqueibacterota bacterium]